MADAIAVLKAQGAIVVDPADVPSFVDQDPKANFVAWDFCSGADQAKGKDEGCSVNFKYGMKRDFNLWLKSLGPSAPVRTLTELREWNLSHTKAGAIRFGQSRLDISDEMDLEADRARFEADHEKDMASQPGERHRRRAHGDIVLTPSSRPVAPAPDSPRAPAIRLSWCRSAWCPTRRHPASRLAFEAKPAPFGVGFTGTACSEPRLIEIATRSNRQPNAASRQRLRRSAESCPNRGARSGTRIDWGGETRAGAG